MTQKHFIARPSLPLAHNELRSAAQQPSRSLYLTPPPPACFLATLDFLLAKSFITASFLPLCNGLVMCLFNLAAPFLQLLLPPCLPAGFCSFGHFFYDCLSPATTSCKWTTYVLVRELLALLLLSLQRDVNRRNTDWIWVISLARLSRNCYCCATFT